MGDTGTLYLHHQSVAREVLNQDSDQDTHSVLLPFQNKRIALVFWSKTDAKVAIVDAQSKSSAAPDFTQLWRETERDIQKPGGDTSSERVGAYGGAWSPDGRFLVIYGDNPDSEMWVLTHSDSVDGGSVAASSPPHILRICPRDLLSTDAQWRRRSSSSIVICGAFFHAKKSSRCFVVTQDAWLLKVEMETADLLMHARSHVTDKEKEAVATRDVFKMQTVTRLTNWHADVTAAAYDPATATLVISGSVKKPSEELRAQNASSLTVWRVTIEDPYVELLDYTMVLGGEESTALATEQQDAENRLGTEAKQDKNSTTTTTTLLKKVRRSMFNPLKLLHGGGGADDDDDDDGGNAVVLPGMVRHLAISSDGVFLSIVDRKGRFRIRQIDTCADVMPWQMVQTSDLDGEGTAVEEIVWTGPSSLSFLTQDHQVAFAFLATNEEDSDDGNGFESDGHGRDPDHREQATRETGSIQTAMQRVMSGDAAATNTSKTARALSSWVDPQNATCFQLHTLDLAVVASSVEERTRWKLSTKEATSPSRLIQTLIQCQQFDRALEVADHCRREREDHHDLMDEADDEQQMRVDLDQVYRQLWTQYRLSVTMDGTESATDPATAPTSEVVVLNTESTTAPGFDKALSYLTSVSHDHSWVATQCLEIVAAWSPVHMKEILATGLRAAQFLQQDPQTRATLLKYLYRLDTLQQLLASELEQDDHHQACYEGTVFRAFRDASMLEIASQLAIQGRIHALEVVFRRNAWNLAPHRLRILQQLPVSMSPYEYVHLLPAIGPNKTGIQEEWQLYTLALALGEGEEEGRANYETLEVKLIAENRSHDLQPDELALFDTCARQEPAHRRGGYALWFTHRMVEMDSLYGHLQHAYELGKCGFYACRLDAQDEEMITSTPMEEFLLNCERLYQCVHTLRLPVCRSISLEDWGVLSLHDQVLTVVEDHHQGEDPDVLAVETVVHRLDVVFLQPRRHRCALDEVISWLCQVLLVSTRRPSAMVHTAHKDPLWRLELCAQLLHQSNPSNASPKRWIQDNATLFRTAIALLSGVSTMTVDLGESSQNDEETQEKKKQRHQVFMDHLWLVFQSLPERKPSDPVEISRLQVQVDHMEDLLIAMDILAQYEISSSPCDLKAKLAAQEEEDVVENGQDTVTDDTKSSRFATELVESLSSCGLSQQHKPWTVIWQDAMKLKKHLFGERLSQEQILSILLKQLLNQLLLRPSSSHHHHDQPRDQSEATSSSFGPQTYDLLANWIGANGDALPIAMEILVATVHQQAQENQLENAATVVNLAKSILALPAVHGTPEAEVFAFQMDEIMQKEQKIRKIQELVEVLSYGTMDKIPRTILQDDGDEKERLQVVLSIFTSDPSHYKMSNDAQQWLYSHNREGQLGQPVVDHVLDGVLYLAQLLDLGATSRANIVLQAAYSALYCVDNETVHRLASHVITTHLHSAAGEEDEEEEGRDREDQVMTLLLSLVLDLVSASSFASWGKKISLLQSLMSSSMNGKLWTHPLFDFLLEKLQKIDAIQALAADLGLSERDVALRQADQQQDGKKWSITDEDILLQELELVVDLLQEDGKKETATPQDGSFELSLLQKGFQLVVAMQLQSDPTLPPSSSSTAASSSIDGGSKTKEMASGFHWIQRVVPQLAVLAFQSASQRRHAQEEDDDEEDNSNNVDATIEVGFAYLLLLSALEQGEEEKEEEQEKEDNEGVTEVEEGSLVHRVWRDDICPLLVGSEGSRSTKNEWLIQRFQRFFVFLAVTCRGSNVDGNRTETKNIRHEIEKLQYSYAATQAALDSSTDLLEQHVDGIGGSNTAIEAEEDGKMTATRSGAALYATLARQCQALLHSYKKTQELETVGSLLQDDVDGDRFAVDAAYRLEMVLRMAQTKDHLATAMEMATKYEIDEYECLLAYIRHAFFPSPQDNSSSSTLSFVARQEQLEQAFRGHAPSPSRDDASSESNESGGDFLDQALQRPQQFGDFLLRGGGVFEKLSGTDHVGILLVLRMVLECSKRTASAALVPVVPASLVSTTTTVFPLSKTSSDRVALLFMCLKRLKESGSNQQNVPNFKLVCGASTAQKLLHGNDASSIDLEQVQHIAMTEILPFLDTKNIKMVTKVLAKLHHMTASTIVLVFLDRMVATLWMENHHQKNKKETPLTTAAAAAYDACVPFLSVLTVDHFLVFHRRFVSPLEQKDEQKEEKDDATLFYGQELLGLARFGGSLSVHKRLEIVASHFTILTNRVVGNTTSPTEMMQHTLLQMEHELVEAAFWVVVDRIDQSTTTKDKTTTTTTTARALFGSVMHDWFALNPHHKAQQQEDTVVNVIVAFYDHFESLECACLLLELAFSVGHSKNSTNRQFVDHAIHELVKKSVSDAIHTFVTRDGSEALAEALVVQWATQLVDVDSKEPMMPQAMAQQLRDSIVNASGSSSQDHVYQEVLQRLGQVASSSSSPLLQRVVDKIREKNRKEEGASSRGDAVVAQYISVVRQYEQQNQWRTSAVLSDVYLSSPLAMSSSSSTRLEQEQQERIYGFGLRVKAVFQWLGRESDSAWVEQVMEISTSEVYAQFASGIFDKLLNVVESDGCQQQPQITIALSNLLCEHEKLRGVATPRKSAHIAWKNEKERGLLRRLAQDFGEDQQQPVVQEVEEEEKQSPPSSPLWTSLLLRGRWEDEQVLMQWLTRVAYGQLVGQSSPSSWSSAIEEFVRTQSETNALSVVMVLLVCPFQELRDHHEAFILDTSRRVLLASFSSTASCSSMTKTQLLELLLFRFGLLALHRVDGFESLLLSFFLSGQPTKKKGKTNTSPLTWTSTSEYAICRLVVAKEYANASRLVCGLWNVHPMLWDLENARLVLGNYLSMLAKQKGSASVEGLAVTHARAVAHGHYQKELL